MKKETSIKIDISNLMADKVGPENGITREEWEDLRSEAKTAFDKCQSEYDAGKIGFMKLPFQRKALEEIKLVAEKNKNKWDNLLVFGIGGSALGITMLFDALSHPYHNQLSNELRNNAPRLFVMDNLDPERLSGLKPVIDPEKTLINIITKSGGTIETWGNYFQYLSVFKSNPENDQVVAITDPETGFLKKFAEINKWQMLPVPSDVGGRFSVLTPVGLFAAAMMNIDIERILIGAGDMHGQCLNPDIEFNPAMKIAATTWHLLQKKRKSISVMMPYCNALGSFADWYQQLWAESLGKAVNLDDQIVHTGQTPVKAIGATDQHSQVQLYREGPLDKMITFLSVDSFRFGGPMTNAPENTPLEELRLLDSSEVLNLEMIGTRDALTESQCPNMTISLPAVTPYHIGQLIYLYELSTYYTGKLLNIDPFDQPGVEAGKIIAKNLIKEVYKERSSGEEL